MQGSGSDLAVLATEIIDANRYMTPTATSSGCRDQIPATPATSRTGRSTSIGYAP